ncbi:MAG TPA: CpsB/CapC family capsule biosynthesis tyrosine phosphatase [Terriglobales bacterium]|nr:CpsB/CapC family capsule biosynthesis tyrosine phosphatase [Terriglobales bacterium]
MIDIHCHILPEVDDGPKLWDVSREMCRMALADGITHIVATPHANDRYQYDREYLVKTLARLRGLVGDFPKLTLGCDFHLSYENLQAALAHPMRYTIQGSNYLLVELSNYSVPAQIGDSFRKLGDKGITPFITHPERNPILQRTPERVLEWVEQGCGIQVTASALAGDWGEKSQSVAKWLLERQAVHVLASDAHDANHRPPNLSEGRDVAAEICGPEIAHALVEDNPRAVINGEPLPYFPTPVSK